MLRITRKFLQSNYSPRGTSGDPYSGDLARILTQAAIEKGFTSPYWLTAKGAEKACVTIPSTTQGTVVHGFGFPITFYNAQQAVSHGAPILSNNSSEIADPSTKLQGNSPPTSQLSVSAHRYLSDKVIPIDIAKKCQKAIFDVPNATPYWGTQREFIAKGFRLNGDAKPYVNNLFNVCQCMNPKEAVALIKKQAGNGAKRLDGTVLPTDLSVKLRSKIHVLHSKAEAIAKLLPSEAELLNALQIVSQATPSYFGTIQQIERFGTTLRKDKPFIAALVVLDAIGRIQITSPLQIRNLFSRAMTDPISFNVVSHTISETHSDTNQAYFPTDFTVNPSVFNADICSRHISPINDDTTLIATPIGMAKSKISITPKDLASMVRYRLQHHLFRSNAWVEVLAAEGLHIGESFIAATNGIQSSPCILEGSGIALYNLEQLHGYSGVADYEGEFFVVDEATINEKGNPYLP